MSYRANVVLLVNWARHQVSSKPLSQRIATEADLALKAFEEGRVAASVEHLRYTWAICNQKHSCTCKVAELDAWLADFEKMLLK